MTDMFDRDFNLQVGTKAIYARSVTGGRLEIMKATFDIDKTGSSEPNTCSLSIHNLATSSREAIQKGQPLIIEAGYVDKISQIFSGDIDYVTHVREGPDLVTTVESGDGSQALGATRISISLGPGTSLSSLLQRVATSMGVGLGNSLSKFLGGGFRKGIFGFTKGVAVSGRAKKILNKYLTSAGFQWSIQDGELQVLRPNETVQEFGVKLTSANLVGSPELSKPKKGEKSYLRARTLLNSSLRPGYRLQIQSREIDGFFKITKVKHTGDTKGNEWYSTIEAKPYEIG